MVCAGNKTKLMVIGTMQLRKSRFNDQIMEVNVCGSSIKDTKSEKLLGLTVNTQLSWKEYLYGEKWRDEENAKGLIPQLSQRAGILSKLVKIMPPQRFRLFCNGIFESKLLKCLEMFGISLTKMTQPEDSLLSPRQTTHNFRFCRTRF